jgi:hypothetical protein
MSITVSKQSLQIGKRSLSNFDENSVISILIEILRHLNALSTPIYTSNAVHVDFSVETIPANRKTQSIKFLRKLCCFIPDWNTTALKSSLHSILHAECSACRFQFRNNTCKSQNAIFQISTKSLSFRSVLRYYGVHKLFPLYSTRRTYRIDFSVENSPCKSQNAVFQTSTKTLLFRSSLW